MINNFPGSSMDPKKQVSIQSFKEGKKRNDTLFVIMEIPLTLYLGEKEIVTLLYNGQHPENLAVGFFFSEGFIEKKEDILDIVYDAKTDICKIIPKKKTGFFEDLYGKRLVTSGCGKGSSFYSVMDSIAANEVNVESELTIAESKLRKMAHLVFRSSPLYKETHGVHSAGLCSLDDMIVFHEDIGRHNALDKIAGQCLLESIDTRDKILYSTGRITSEMMVKTGRMGCPIVVSRSSATNLALELAEKIGITVVGGVRKSSFHVYTETQRIIL